MSDTLSYNNALDLIEILQDEIKDHEELLFRLRDYLISGKLELNLDASLYAITDIENIIERITYIFECK